MNGEHQPHRLDLLPQLYVGEPIAGEEIYLKNSWCGRRRLLDRTEEC